MADELQAENNRLYRLFQKFSTESKTVTIASVSMIISLLSLLMAFMALNDAKEARILAEVKLELVESTINDKLSLNNDAADVQFKMMMQNRVKLEQLEKK